MSMNHSSSLSTAKRVASGVDWITATVSHLIENKPYLELGKSIVADQIRSGHKEQRFSAYGYEGKSAGSACYGVRKDTYYVRLSSGCAKIGWKEVLRLGGKPSRIDLQQTYLLEKPTPQLFEGLYKQSLGRDRKQGRAKKTAIILNSTGGDTVYYGSRASDNYGRIYDKGVEQRSNEPGILIRAEVEYKKGLAQQIANAVFFAEKCEEEINLFLTNFFAREGVCLAEHTDRDFENARVDKTKSLVRSLRWLNEGVAPALRKIAAIVGEEELLNQLGYDGARIIKCFGEIPTLQKQEEIYADRGHF